MSSELSFSKEMIGDVVIISISGEVDIYTAQKLKNELYGAIDSNVKSLKIDCCDLNYIDSTGLGIFVGVLKKAKKNKKNIHIINSKENIRKLFTITGLDKLFIME